MKKLIFFVAALAAMMTACSVEKDMPDTSEGQVFTIHAPLSATKTSFDLVGYKVSWDDDDVLSVLAQDKDGKYTNYKFVKGEGDTFTCDAVTDPENITALNVFYPYNSRLSGLGKSGCSNRTFEISGVLTQNGAGDAGHIADIPMCGYADGPASDGSWSVDMMHISSVFEVEVKNVSDKELSVMKVSISVDDADAALSGTFWVNPQNGTLENSDIAPSASVNVAGCTLSPDETGTFYIPAAPFVLTSGSALAVTVNSGNDTETEKTMTKETAFAAGKVHHIKNVNAVYGEGSEEPVIGDFFFSDGTWGELTAENKDRCVGIVYAAGVQNGDDISKYGETNASKSILGYVMSLDEIKPGDYPGIVGNNLSSDRAYFYSETMQPEDRFTEDPDRDCHDGYAKTELMLSSEQYKASPENYVALEMLAEWRKDKKYENASDWYLPTVRQLMTVLGGYYGYGYMSKDFSGAEPSPLIAAALESAKSFGLPCKHGNKYICNVTIGESTNPIRVELSSNEDDTMTLSSYNERKDTGNFACRIYPVLTILK